MSYDSDNFAYVGQRVTGSDAGHFAIVGPDWSGELPEGVELAGRSPTSMVIVGGRTLVDGPEDLEAVHVDQWGQTRMVLGQVPARNFTGRKFIRLAPLKFKPAIG